MRLGVPIPDSGVRARADVFGIDRPEYVPALLDAPAVRQSSEEEEAAWDSIS